VSLRNFFQNLAGFSEKVPRQAPIWDKSAMEKGTRTQMFLSTPATSHKGNIIWGRAQHSIREGPWSLESVGTGIDVEGDGVMGKGGHRVAVLWGKD
jgi:hypothetical protein